MTADQIRAQYVAVIGETAVEKLEAAGLLPTVQELEWRLDSANQVLTDTRWTVPYIRSARYCTDWADLPG